MAGLRRTLEDIALVSAALNSSDASRAASDVRRLVENEQRLQREWRDYSAEAEAQLEKGEQFFDSAETHRANGEWEDAIHDYAVALTSFPETAYRTTSGMFMRQECRLNRIRCFRELGDLENAVLECIDLYALPLTPDADFGRSLQALLSDEFRFFRVKDGELSVRPALDQIRSIDRDLAQIEAAHRASVDALRAREDSVMGRGAGLVGIGLLACFIFGLFGAIIPGETFWSVGAFPLPLVVAGILVMVLGSGSKKEPAPPSTHELAAERRAIVASIVWLTPPPRRSDAPDRPAEGSAGR